MILSVFFFFVFETSGFLICFFYCPKIVAVLRVENIWGLLTTEEFILHPGLNGRCWQAQLTDMSRTQNVVPFLP